MSYNWKCCSFYPNNFDASALVALKKSSHLGRGTHVPRSEYACTSAGGRMYLGRSTHVLRSWYDDRTVPFAQLSASFQTTIEPSRTAPLRGFKRQ